VFLASPFRPVVVQSLLPPRWIACAKDVFPPSQLRFLFTEFSSLGPQIPFSERVFPKVAFQYGTANVIHTSCFSKYVFPPSRSFFVFFRRQIAWLPSIIAVPKRCGCLQTFSRLSCALPPQLPPSLVIEELLYQKVPDVSISLHCHCL